MLYEEPLFHVLPVWASTQFSHPLRLRELLFLLPLIALLAQKYEKRKCFKSKKRSIASIERFKIT
jgi:hypothetical protein